MRGITVMLPPEAAAKLQELDLARMAAEDALRGIAARIADLPPDAGAMHGRLAAERDRQSRRHSALHQLLNRVQQWQRELNLPPGIVLEMAPAVEVGLKPGEKLVDVIEAVRTEIAGLRAKLAAVKAAPLPQADVVSLIEGYV